MHLPKLKQIYMFMSFSSLFYSFFHILFLPFVCLFLFFVFFFIYFICCFTFLHKLFIYWLFLLFLHLFCFITTCQLPEYLAVYPSATSCDKAMVYASRICCKAPLFSYRGKTGRLRLFKFVVHVGSTL